MTFLTADKALPWSTKKYRELYSGLMRELPTLELASNTTNTIGNKVLVNKEVVGNTVHDIVLFETSNDRSGQIISAPTAEVTLYDLNAFIYQLDLENPLMLRNDGDSQWALSKADSARFFLNFSGQIASLASALPSQLSIKELQENIAIHRSALEKETARYEEKLQKARLNLATLTQQEMVSPERVEEAAQEVSNLEKKKPINFYYQYYRAELHKKFALSAACFMLVFLTFSFSFFKVKHGRLIGFGMSMLVAVLYWYLLFFSQMQIFKFPIHPGLLIWIPNVLMFLSGVLIMLFARRL
jgi:lipopolysaccharide export system permease protein